MPRQKRAISKAGGAAGRAIVEPEIAEVIDARDIGQHGDDRNVGARKLADRLAHQRMIEHLHGDAGAAALGAHAQTRGERRRVHRLDERDLDVRARLLGDARERIGERLGAAAALAREHGIEPLRCVDRWRGGARRAGKLADRLLDTRDASSDARRRGR